MLKYLDQFSCILQSNRDIVLKWKGKGKIRGLKFTMKCAAGFLTLLCKGPLHPDILSGMIVLIWCLSEKVTGIHHVLFFTIQNVTAWLCMFEYIGRIYFPLQVIENITTAEGIVHGQDFLLMPFKTFTFFLWIGNGILNLSFN